MYVARQATEHSGILMMNNMRSTQTILDRLGCGRYILPLWVIGVASLVACVASLSLAAQTKTDFKGYRDPAMFSRMPNYYLQASSSFVDKQFDAYEFPVTDGKKLVKERIEGHFVQYYYYFDHSVGAVPSPLQIIRNYQNAGMKIGAQILYEQVALGNRMHTTLKLLEDGRETWAEVESGSGSNYYLRIVERQEMRQHVTASAEAMQAGLAQNGHVEVPGIFFDFGKADIKAESEPALQEMEKLLKVNPAVRVWVVGHTDYVGSADSNVSLAQARAAAVVKALAVRNAIDVRRVLPFGVGPYAPVASNATDEGRAKNRRVELVAQPER